MTSTQWSQAIGLIITAIGMLLAHYRISKNKTPPK